jgi:hypothetical protein
MDKDGRMKEERCQGNGDRRGVGVFVIDGGIEAESGGGLRDVDDTRARVGAKAEDGKQARARERATMATVRRVLQ